ncbi:TetR/AcrR family transcriptional regulator [Sphingosinicella sp. BN140058]|uniref:TetR/AcrR family transcriptional regulator n=1 Tax=Sphingosinicella sp. BN140058 TaxID=1892855 RepID=UPI001FB0C139|nr:TetR/AcrR family transcriptional regulator [Sphingosinicella sp. BN140058]
MIEEGLRLISEGPADQLSLRELARRVGVSATAVYRHFPDKSALMGALAAEGLARLAAAQHAAFEGAGGGIKGFAATGAAYVRFALANPALFRLIFQHPAPADLMQGAHGSDAAMQFLLANARIYAPAHMDPQVFALQAWSVAHGLAMLMLDGQVPADDAVVDAVIGAHLAQKLG